MANKISQEPLPFMGVWVPFIMPYWSWTKVGDLWYQLLHGIR